MLKPRVNYEVSYCTDGLGGAYCTYSLLGVSPLFGGGGHAQFRMGKGRQLLGLNSSFLGSSRTWLRRGSILKGKGEEGLNMKRHPEGMPLQVKEAK